MTQNFKIAIWLLKIQTFCEISSNLFNPQIIFSNINYISNYDLEVYGKMDIGNMISSFAAILAAAGAFFSAYTNLKAADRKNEVDVKIKSRIAWIQEVRHKTADVLAAYYEYKLFHNKLSNNSSHDLKLDELKAKLKFLKSVELLSLYFADDSKVPNNLNLQDKNSEGYQLLLTPKKGRHTNKGKHPYIIKLLDSLKDNTLTKDDDIQKLKQIISQYLKIEWDRAKNS